MNAPLYTTDILRLAASLPEPRELARPDGIAEIRSPTCGSSLRTAVQLDSEGRIEAISQQVQACAFGQASAALVAQQAPGRSRQQIAEALEALNSWLSGEAESPGEWPGLEALAPARSRAGRHGAILLPLKTLAAAMEQSSR